MAQLQYLMQIEELDPEKVEEVRSHNRIQANIYAIEEVPQRKAKKIPQQMVPKLLVKIAK